MTRVPTDIETEINRFCSSVKLLSFTRSIDLARETIKLLKKIIGESKWSNGNELIQLIRSQAHRINEGQAADSITFNVTRHVLKLIREVSNRLIHGKTEAHGTSLTFQAVLNRTSNDEENEEKYSTRRRSSIHSDLSSGDVSVAHLKPELMDDLGWYADDIELSVKNLSEQSVAHIHANETILTLGYSYTIEQFFRHAAKKKRRFHVFILEDAPLFTGRKMAAALSEFSISVTVVTDSAVFAIMARVNKIIIGARSVLANGGLTAKCGTSNLALAAKNYNVPLLVCTPTYKISPTYLPSFDPVICNTFSSPENILPYQSVFQSSLDVIVPTYDYVPPELVTLIIGSGTGNAPSYVYGILSELYSPEDNDLERFPNKPTD